MESNLSMKSQGPSNHAYTKENWSHKMMELTFHTHQPLKSSKLES